MLSHFSSSSSSPSSLRSFLRSSPPSNTLSSPRWRKRTRLCSSTGWEDAAGREESRRPLFAVSTAGEDLSLTDVVAVIDDAERYFPVNRSARIEYCRSKGVSYERFERYIEVVAGFMLNLEIDYDDAAEEDATEVDEAEKNKKDPFENNSNEEKSKSTTNRVKIVGTPIVVVRPSDMCPICNSFDHVLATCPNLPDDMRPYC